MRGGGQNAPLRAAGSHRQGAPGAGTARGGAAKGAGIGAGIYKDNNEAFATLDKLAVIEPDMANKAAYEDAYQRWLSYMNKI